MRAALFESYGQPLKISDIPEPACPEHGVVVQVKATGLCRSDWHGWMGHDPDVKPPHVPGHEFAGLVAAVGRDVVDWEPGDRVTLPFVCACGRCPQCLGGHHQVCDRQIQPGVTQWGAFAERVAVPFADINLVRLPDAVDFVTAASLGCRFATAFRAVVDRGRAAPGEWVAVYGCGGLGLSAVMIADAVGAQVVGIDIAKEKLNLARAVGAKVVIDASRVDNVVAAVHEITRGGAHMTVDALGSPTTCFNAIQSLRKRGRHVQAGLLLATQRTPPLPMDRVVAQELAILGTHGMPAHRYPAMLAMIAAGKLQPAKLIGRTVDLETGMEALQQMDRFEAIGVTVIDRF